jgi:hypothetical protein
VNVTGVAAAKLMAVLASGLCLFAGGFLLFSNYADEDLRLLSGWIGIFFIGMSLFVGPALWLLADLRERSEAAGDADEGEEPPGGPLRPGEPDAAADPPERPL